MMTELPTDTSQLTMDEPLVDTAQDSSEEGRLLFETERTWKGTFLRIHLQQCQGHHYINIQEWTRKDGKFVPKTRKRITIHRNELHRVIFTLINARGLFPVVPPKLSTPKPTSKPTTKKTGGGGQKRPQNQVPK